MSFDKYPAGLSYLGSHRIDIGVFGRLVVMKQVQPVAPELDQALGIVGEPDDQRVFCLEQFGRQRHSWDKRHVCSLDAAIREIKASGRLRRTRHPDETYIRIVQTPAGLPVIMIEGKSHCVDSRKIFAVEEMLFARQASALAAEIGGKRADYRIENRNGRRLNSATALLKQLAKSIADEGEQHDPAIGFDPGDHPLDLTARAHHAPDMFDRLRPVELDETGSSHRMNRFSGRVGNKMKVKPRHNEEPRAMQTIPLTMCLLC